MNKNITTSWEMKKKPEELKSNCNQIRPLLKMTMTMTTTLKNLKNKEQSHRKFKICTSRFLLNLPGVVATDSISYRIEALRVYLER
jgi:hypothetical protein